MDKKENYTIFRVVLEKLRKGDEISDFELERTIPILQKMVEFSRALGPKFHLFWKELNDNLSRLEEIQDARKNPINEFKIKKK